HPTLQQKTRRAAVGGVRLGGGSSFGELRRRQPRVNDEETRLPAELHCSFRVISIARPFAASRRLRTEARGRLWTVARATGVFVGSGGAGSPGSALVVRGSCGHGRSCLRLGQRQADRM